MHLYYPTYKAPTTAGVMTNNSEYLTVKEAKHFKEKLIESFQMEKRKIIKILREEYETFKEEQKRIIKKLREEIKNLKSK